jgi:hypothetical protein
MLKAAVLLCVNVISRRPSLSPSLLSFISDTPNISLPVVMATRVGGKEAGSERGTRTSLRRLLLPDSDETTPSALCCLVWQLHGFHGCSSDESRDERLLHADTKVQMRGRAARGSRTVGTV